MTTLTAAHASIILSLIGDMTLRDLQQAGAIDAVAALTNMINDDRTVTIYMSTFSDRTGWVDQIKATRFATGLGLKEAKELVEIQNPGRLNFGKWKLIDMKACEADDMLDKLTRYFDGQPLHFYIQRS